MIGELKISLMIIGVMAVVMSLLIFESIPPESSNDRVYDNQIISPRSDGGSLETITIQDNGNTPGLNADELTDIIEDKFVDKAADELVKAALERYTPRSQMSPSIVIEGTTYYIHQYSSDSYFLQSSTGTVLNVKSDSLGAYVKSPSGNIHYFEVYLCINGVCNRVK